MDKNQSLGAEMIELSLERIPLLHFIALGGVVSLQKEHKIV